MWFKVPILLASIFVLGGCSYQFPEYPTKLPAACQAKADAGGLAVGADPIFDSATSHRYFDTDLCAHGVLAIYVVVENHSADKSYLIRSEAFSLKDHDRKQGDVDSSSSAGNAMAVTGAVLLSPVLLAVGAGVIADADNVKVNYQKKALRTQSISPGESTSGFLYFQLPKNSVKGSSVWILQLDPDGLSASASRTPVQILIKNGKE